MAAEVTTNGNVLCSICTENYKSTDVVYGTSCGHVYHEKCMEDWRHRSGTCPQCRTSNPNTFKLYLTFEDVLQSEMRLDNMKCQLEDSVCNASELQHSLDETRRNFVELQTLQGNYEAELEKRQQKINYLTMQNEQWQMKNIKLDEIKSTLNDSMQTMQEKIHLLSAENEQLKLMEVPVIESTVRTDVALSEKLQLTEEKLKQLKLQLEIEITNSTTLTVENMRLKCLLKAQSKAAVPAPMPSAVSAPIISSVPQCVALSAPVPITTPAPCSIPIPDPTIQNQGNNIAVLRKPTPNPPHQNLFNFPSKDKQQSLLGPQMMTLPEAVTSITNTSLNVDSIQSQSNEMTQVAIRNLTKDQLQKPLKPFILELALKMELTDYTEADIQEITIVENKYKQRTNPKSYRPSVNVKFISLAKKIKFLGNKKKLENYADTKNLIIQEFNTEDIHQLYHYAKSLRQYGYFNVYTQNNIVWAKRFKYSDPERILSNSHVDQLKNSCIQQQMQQLGNQLKQLETTTSQQQVNRTANNQNQKTNQVPCDGSNFEDESCDEEYYLKI